MAEKLAIFDEEKSIAALRAVSAETDIVIAKFRETITVVNQASQAFNRGTPREYIRGMQQASVANANLADINRRIEIATRNLQIAQDREAGTLANITAQTRALNAANRDRANEQVRLASLNDQERQRLGSTIQTYNLVQQRLNRLQAEYRNLAVAKQLGAQLTDREISRMAALERAIQRYDQTLKAVDASMGRHQRNVGNYASGFNAMNNSVAQMAREMPAFTYSMQTGFMALSNNIPIFADALAAARVQNAQLRAEGQATVPVWKQVTTAFASWNILLSVGITLLTVYGQKIFESIKNMVSMKTKADVMAEAQENLNKQMSEGAADSIVKYKTLQDEWNNLTDSIQSKNKFIVENSDKFRDLGVEIGNTSDAEKFFADGSANFIQVLMLRAKAAAYAQTAIETYKKAIQDETQENKDFGAGGWKSQLNTVLSATIGWRPFDSLGQQASDAGKKAGDEFIKMSNELKTEATKLQDALGLKPAPKGGSTKTDKNSSDAQKDSLRDLEAARDTMLAVNERMYVEGLQDERKYLQENLRINSEFYNQKIKLLKGRTAEERKQKADADLEQSKLEKETQKKIFDIDFKEREENHKKKISEFDRYNAEINENKYLSETDRLKKQIESDNKMIEELTSYYEDQIKLAEKANQQTLEIERKRDEEVGKVQDARLKKLGALPEVFNKDLDRISEISANMQNTDYEKIRLDILQKKMSLRDREFALNQLDLEFERISLLNQRNDLLLKKNQLEPLKEAGKLTKDQEKQYSEIESKVAGINSQLDITAKNLEQIKLDRFLEDLQPLRDLVGNGLNDLGLTNVANQFDEMFKKIIDGSFSAKDAVVLAASAISDGLTAINSRQKENTIAALDEQLKYTQETTEQEIGFINERLERLNSLETLTEEQAAERNRLEDEARTYKEQQFQREKLIEAQKARAEQKAAANQALINGALAATVTMAQLGFPAGVIPAAAAFGFGLAQSIAIMAKDPVPKYRVGRKGGKSEFAITQDGGREMITNSKGEIKSLGSDKGDTLTYLDRGDNVHTAKETKAILSRVGALPKVGDKIFQKIAMQSLMAPAPIVINKTVDNSDAIAEKIAKKFESTFQRFTHPTTERVNGKIIRHRGANFGEVIGYYDITTGAEISFEDYQKNRSHD